MIPPLWLVLILSCIVFCNCGSARLGSGFPAAGRDCQSTTTSKDGRLSVCVRWVAARRRYVMASDTRLRLKDKHLSGSVRYETSKAWNSKSDKTFRSEVSTEISSLFIFHMFLTMKISPGGEFCTCPVSLQDLTQLKLQMFISFTESMHKAGLVPGWKQIWIIQQIST